MNKIYRVKFNRSLGEYQVTSELSSVENKSTNNTSGFINRFRNLTVYVFIFSLLGSNISAALASSGITVNGSDTSVTTSSTSGASVIDIAKPNKNGLSYNKYSDFNINNPGVVFNNSDKDSVTDVVGNIQGNKKLEGSNAKIILNEVNGINSTKLQGTMEVAGKKASIIIANQNGIIVDGVKTINADALTLTTGKVDASNLSFDVSKGNILIKGDGVNTTGLSKFDVITQSAKLSATVGNKAGSNIVAGNTDINIIAGNNKVEYGTNKISSKNNTTLKGIQPAIEIGGDALGSIYGNNITLVSTTSGAGVRQTGLISSPNDIKINSAGTVSLDNAQSKNLNIEATDSVIAKNIKTNDTVNIINTTGKMGINNAQSKSINLVSSSDLLLKNIVADTVDIDTKGNLSIGTSDIANQNSIDAKELNIAQALSTHVEGSISSDKLNIKTDGMIVNNAIIETKDADINVENNLIINGQYSIVDFKGNKINNATAYVDKNKYGEIVAVDQTGKELDNVTIVSNSGLVTDNLKLNAGQQLSNSMGNISSKNDLNISANNINNSGILSGNKKLTIDVRNRLDNQFLIQGGETIINASNINNNAKINANDDMLSIKSKNDLINTGNINSGKFTFDGQGLAALKNDNGRISAMLYDIDAKKIINDNNGLINAIQANEQYANSINKIKTDSIYSDRNSLISMGTFGIDLTTQEIAYGGNDISTTMLPSSAIDLSSSASSNLYSNQNLTLNNAQLYLSKTKLDVKGDVNIKGGSNVSYKNSFNGVAANFNIEDSVVGANYYRGIVNPNKIPTQISEDENNGIFTLALSDNFNNKNSSLLVSKGSINSASLYNNGQMLGLDFDFKSNDFNNDKQINAWRNVKVNANNFSNYLKSEITAGDKISIVSKDTENKGNVLAESIAVNSDALTNTVDGLLEGKHDIEISSKETENSGKVLSDYVHVIGDVLKNKDKSEIKAKNIKIELNQNAGLIDNSGDILATDNIDVTTRGYLNDKNIYAGKNATINIKNNNFIINDKSQTAYGGENLNYNVDKDMTVNRDIINPGNINIISNNLLNNELMYSLKNIEVITTNFVNYTNAYLGAENNIAIRAESVKNHEDSTIFSQNILTFFAKEFVNLVGNIKGKNEVNITTGTFLNEGVLSGDITAKDKASTGYYKELPHSGGGAYSFKFENLKYAIPDGSNLTVKQGVIESDKNINLNIRENGTNKGVIAAVKGDLNINNIGEKNNVSFNNETLGADYSITDFLKGPDNFSMRVYRKRLALKGDKTIAYANLYEFFNDVFGNPDKKIKYGPYSYHNYNVITILQDNQFLNSISGDENQMLKNTMSMIFGAEWKALGSGELQKRWNNFTENQNNSKYSINILPKTNTMMVAGNNHQFNGINFTNGEPSVTKEKIEGGFNDKRDIKIGKNEVSGVEGQLADLQNKDIINSIGGYNFEQFNKGELPNVNGLYNNNKLVFKTEIKDKYNYKDISFNPKDVNTTTGPGYDKGMLVNYLYQTKIPFNDNDYYGSNYYFKTLGLYIKSQNNNPIYTVGDSYFENNLIADQYRKLNKQNGYSLTPAEIAKELMDNAKGEMDKQRLVVGQPLTKEQINNLQTDIVWYEWAAAASGEYVLTPRVYVSNTSSQLDTALGKGASVIAGNDINIKSENGSFINSNGTLLGNNVNIDMGDEGFVYTGSKASNGESISAGSINIKSGDVYIEGNGIIADNIDIEANKDVNIKTGMEYINGALINATENSLSTAGEGNISIKGDNINLTGAGIDTQGGTLSLEAQNDIVMKDVYQVYSSKEVNTYSKGASWGHDMKDTSRAESSGSSLNSGNLSISTGLDFKITGGSINTESSQVDVGGDMTVEAGKNLDYYYKETSFTGLFGSAAGNTAYNNNNPGGYNVQASTSLTPNSYAVNAPGTGSVGAGFSHSETKDTKNSLTHKNAQLNLGNSEINVEKTFDFGGADINTSFKPKDDNDLSTVPTLTVNAGNILTTKFEDKVEREYHESSWSFGVKATGESNVAKFVTDSVNMKNQDEKSRGTNNAGMKAGLVATDVANLVLGDIAGGSIRIGFDKSENNSSSTVLNENKNNIFGNINFNSKKDITLNNVDISNSNEVTLIAKENVNINAGKSSFTEKTDSSSLSVGVDARAGVGALGAGASLSVGASGTKGSSHKDGTKYTNSNISANNINITSGNDLNIKGGVVGNDNSNVTVDSGGNINIESIQDIIQGDGQITTVGASLGVAAGVGAKGGAGSPVGATGGVNVSVSKQHTDVKDVNEQSGIKGNNVVIKGDKDLNLTGGFIEANDGQIDIAGDIDAKEIKDVIKDSDKTITAGASVGGRPGSIIPNPTKVAPGYGGGLSGGYGQGNNTDKEETNHATITMGNGSINVAGTTHGYINTDKDKQVTVDKDVYTGAYQFEGTAPIVGPKRKQPGDVVTTTSEFENRGSGSTRRPATADNGRLTASENQAPEPPNNGNFTAYEELPPTITEKPNSRKFTEYEEQPPTTPEKPKLKGKNSFNMYESVGTSKGNQGIKNMMNSANSETKTKFVNTVDLNVGGKTLTIKAKTPQDMVNKLNNMAGDGKGIVTGEGQSWTRTVFKYDEATGKITKHEYAVSKRELGTYLNRMNTSKK
ncbi:hemagglutinin repeat-containing protein [Yokenella regensburgei]|uniref:two-partner secretion domain-containing protein n=1 Tax=Yokenella regensburgei TaxID=158877 RepID=UPI0013761D9B|nr:hemagglutinin repeat-containing protein [Yokenella regensburgei]KAF1366711.1 filamentous hemagglutinin [Yokenella regensburgei]